MTEQFITELKASPYFERILIGHDVIMISLTGSRLIDIIDERSDFDLIALTNEQERTEHVDEFLTYNGKKVHWHYVPVTKLIANENGSLMSCYGEVLFANLDNSKIIYENPVYSAVIAFLKANKTIVSQVGIYGIVQFHYKLINALLLNGEIREENYCKFIYHLCYASYLVFNEIPDAAFLTAIKRIRWQPTEEYYKIQAIERIARLKEYVMENPLNLQEIIYTFNNEIQRLLT